MDIADTLKALNEKEQITQAELSRLLGSAQSTISRVINGGQIPNFTFGLRVIELAWNRGLLTNKSGTIKVSPSIEIRGRLSVSGQITTVTGGLIEIAELPFPVPFGCFGVVIETDGVTGRGRRGDLLIVGPSTTDVSSMIEAEGLYRLADGNLHYGVLIEGRTPENFTILGEHSRRLTDAGVVEASPFFAILAAGRWQVVQ